jgi:hypothetical protein
MHDKSRPRHAAKKPGKSLKDKRAEKRAAKGVQTGHPSVIPSAHPTRAAR